MSVLEQVIVLGQQLNPEERQLVIDTWLTAPEGENVGKLSPETERILQDTLGRIERGEAVFYSIEETMAMLTARRNK